MKGSIVNLMDANVHIKIKKFFSEHFKSDQTEDFKCKKKCGKRYVLRYEFEQHLLIHGNKHEFKCPKEGCDKTFNAKHLLSRHMNYHKVVQMEIKPRFKCPHQGCNKSYK